MRIPLAAGETLAIDHPGFWLGEAGRTDRLTPYIDNPVPGSFRVRQEVGLSTQAAGRKALPSTTPQVILSAERKPHRIQAEVLGSSADELSPSLSTGEIKVTFARS